MSSSTYAGMIPFQTSDMAAADPFDVAQSRTLLNNAVHLADSAGSVTACWMAVAGQYLEPQYLGAPTSTATLVMLSLPIRVTMGLDGLPFRLRVRFAGMASAGTATVTFNVGIGVSAVAAAFSSTALSKATTATTSAWLDPGDTVIAPTVSDVWRWGVPGHATAGGTAFETAYQFGTMIHVVGQSTDWSLAVPRLTGLYVADWVGV